MPTSDERINWHLPTATIVKVVLVLIGLYLLYLITDIVALLFASLVFAAAIDPWVDWLQKYKVPRSLGVIMIYLGLLLIMTSVIYLIIPPITAQVSELSQNFPDYLEKISVLLTNAKTYAARYDWLIGAQGTLSGLSNKLTFLTSNLFSTISSVFGGIFAFFLVIVVTFYMVVEENALKKLIWSITPDKQQTRIISLMNRVQKKIGVWFRGQLLLCVIIFLLTFAGLSVLGVRYALVLAIIAGITEIIPYLGPILGAIPALFLAFTQSPMLALVVLALYLIIQAMENNIFVPKIMQRALGLNPIISISVLMIGFKVSGVVGAILAIPLTTALSVILKDVYHYRRLNK